LAQMKRKQVEGTAQVWQWGYAKSQLRKNGCINYFELNTLAYEYLIWVRVL